MLRGSMLSAVTFIDGWSWRLSTPSQPWSLCQPTMLGGQPSMQKSRCSVNQRFEAQSRPSVQWPTSTKGSMLRGSESTRDSRLRVRVDQGLDDQSQPKAWCSKSTKGSINAQSTDNAQGSDTMVEDCQALVVCALSKLGDGWSLLYQIHARYRRFTDFRVGKLKQTNSNTSQVFRGHLDVTQAYPLACRSFGHTQVYLQHVRSSFELCGCVDANALPFWQDGCPTMVPCTKAYRSLTFLQCIPLLGSRWHTLLAIHDHR